MVEATPDKPVNAKPLGFPSAAGALGLLAAVAAGLTAIPGWSDYSEPLRIGLLAVLGAGLLGGAIAAAGDALARAYVVANTAEVEVGNQKLVKPAMEVAADKLTEALRGLPSAAQRQGEGLLPLPVSVDISVDGNDKYQAIAVRQLANAQLEFLAGRPGGRLDWYGEKAVTRAAIAAPAPQMQVMGLPAAVQVKMGARKLSAIAVRLGADGQPNSFLVGEPGQTFGWVPAERVAAP